MDRLSGGRNSFPAFICVLALLAAGQPVLKAQNSKLWTEGPLQWSDFKTVEQPCDTSSLAFLSLNYAEKVVRDGFTTYRYDDVHATFNKDLSWVSPDFRTDDELARNQAYFDYVESLARDIRSGLLLGSRQRHDLEKEAAKAVKSIRGEIMQAEDLSVYAVEPDDFDISKHPFSYGRPTADFSAGAGVVLPFASLGRLVGPVTALSLSECVDFGKASVMLEEYFGTGMSTGKYAGVGGKNDPYRAVPYFSASLKGAYTLFDAGRVSLAAVAGAGYTSLTFNKFRTAGLTLSEGVCADFQLHRTLYYTLERPCGYDQSIRVKLYADQMKAATGKFIPSLNLSLSFDILVGRLRAE